MNSICRYAAGIVPAIFSGNIFNVRENHMKHTAFTLVISSLLLLCGSLACRGELVARWVADDLDAGEIQQWEDQENSIIANTNGQPTAVEDAIGSHQAVFFDGSSAYSVDSSVNPIIGTRELTATAVFKADASIGQGGSSVTWWNGTDPNPFWSHSLLVGVELGGGGVGDWGLGVTKTQVLSGGAGIDGDRGVLDTTDVSDNLPHVGSLVIDGVLSNCYKLFLDGQLVQSLTNIAGDQTFNGPINIGINIFNITGDTHYYTGYVAEVQIDSSALIDGDVLALHTDLMTTYGIPEPVFFTVLGVTGCLLCIRRMKK